MGPQVGVRRGWGSVHRWVQVSIGGGRGGVCGTTGRSKEGLGERPQVGTGIYRVWERRGVWDHR